MKYTSTFEISYFFIPRVFSASLYLLTLFIIHKLIRQSRSILFLTNFATHNPDLILKVNHLLRAAAF